jgi:hypothetical protein
MLIEKLQDDIQSSNRKNNPNMYINKMTIKYTKPKTMLKWGTCWNIYTRKIHGVVIGD